MDQFTIHACQGSRWSSGLPSGFMVFNKVIPVKSLISWGLSTFIYSAHEACKIYPEREVYGNERKTEISNNPKTVIKTLCKEWFSKYMTNPKDALLYIGGKQFSGICEGCPSQMKCMYSSADKGTNRCWENFYPHIGKNTCTLAMPDTKLPERIPLLMKYISNERFELQHKQDFKGFKYMSPIRVSTTNACSFETNYIDPTTEIDWGFVEKNKKRFMFLGKRTSANASLLKQCAECVFKVPGKEYRTCYRFPGSWGKNSHPHCWQLQQEKKTIHKIPPYYTTAEQLDKLVIEGVTKLGKDTVSHILRQSTNRYETRRHKLYNILPNIKPDLTWDGKWILVQKAWYSNVVNGRYYWGMPFPAEVTTLEDIQSRFSKIERECDITDRTIELYVEALMAFMNRGHSMLDLARGGEHAVPKKDWGRHNSTPGFKGFTYNKEFISFQCEWNTPTSFHLAEISANKVGALRVAIRNYNYQVKEIYGRKDIYHYFGINDAYDNNGGWWYRHAGRAPVTNLYIKRR